MCLICLPCFSQVPNGLMLRVMQREIERKKHPLKDRLALVKHEFEKYEKNSETPVDPIILKELLREIKNCIDTEIPKKAVLERNAPEIQVIKSFFQDVIDLHGSIKNAINTFEYDGYEYNDYEYFNTVEMPAHLILVHLQVLKELAEEIIRKVNAEGASLRMLDAMLNYYAGHFELLSNESNKITKDIFDRAIVTGHPVNTFTHTFANVLDAIRYEKSRLMAYDMLCTVAAQHYDEFPLAYVEASVSLAKRVYEKSFLSSSLDAIDSMFAAIPTDERNRNFLLVGESGTGKTTAMHALAEFLSRPCIIFDMPKIYELCEDDFTIVSTIVSEVYACNMRCMILFENIDAISPLNEDIAIMIKTVMATCENSNVIVVGTMQEKSLALQLSDDRTNIFQLSLPSALQRFDALKYYLENIDKKYVQTIVAEECLDESFIHFLAKKTRNCSYYDLQELIDKAQKYAYKDHAKLREFVARDSAAWLIPIFQDLDIEKKHFKKALQDVTKYDTSWINWIKNIFL